MKCLKTFLEILGQQTLEQNQKKELEDDDYLSFESESEDIEVENIDTTAAWDDNKSTAAKPGAIFKLSTDYNKKIRAANKIKNKYLKKKIGQREKSNKISAEWLKTAGYQDTKDQDKINYMYIPPKKETTNNIPADAAHFLRTEIDSTDFKNENLTTKIRRNKSTNPYLKKKILLKILKQTKPYNFQMKYQLLNLEKMLSLLPKNIYIKN